MASKHISDLIQFSGSISGDELMMLQEGGVTRRVAISDVYASASISVATSASIASLQVQINGKVSSSNYNIDSSSFSTRVTREETSSSLYVIASASLSTRVTNEEATSSVFVNTSASLQRYNVDSGSFNTNIGTRLLTSVYTTDSSSFSTRITKEETSSSLYVTASGSLSTRTTNLESTASVFATTSASLQRYNVDSGSFNTNIGTRLLTSVYTTDSASFTGRITVVEAASASLQRYNVDSGSFNTNIGTRLLTSTYTTDSASFTGRITVLEAASASLQRYNVDSGSFNTNIGTRLLNTVYLTDSGSFSTRITKEETSSSLYVTASGSLSTRVTNVESTASFYVTSSGSFSTRITNTEATSSAYVLASSSLSTRVTNLETGSVKNNQTGSFATILGNSFNGNQIVTGSVTASGSLSVIGIFDSTGSLNNSGSFRQTGNTLLSGSVVISSSYGSTTPTIQIYGDVAVNGYSKYLPITSNINTIPSASYIYCSGSTNDLYFAQSSLGYNNVTRLRWIEGNLYTGLLSGGLLQQSSSTTFNITSGSGIIVSMNASVQQEPYPIIKYVKWNNILSVTSSFIGQADQTFIGIDANGNVSQQITPWTDGQNNTSLFLGIALHQNRTTFNGMSTFPDVAYGYKQRSYDFIKAFGALKLTGYTMAPSASSTGSLIIGSGTSWSDGRNYSVDPNNPSYISENGTTVSRIFRYYSSGSGFIYDTNGGAGYGAIDYAQYNNNGTLTAVPGTGAHRQWQNQRVFWFPNSATKGIFIYYGNSTYTSQNEAITNLPYEQFSEAANTQNSAIYLGSLTVRNDANFTDSSTYKILPGGIFRSLGGSSGTSGGAVLTLGDLSNVDNSLPSNGDSLIYDTATSMWTHGSASWANNLVGYAANSASFSASIATNNNNAVHITGTETITGAKTLSAVTTINNLTNSTNIGSGALIINGGLGVASSSFIGGDLNLANDGAAIKFVNAGTNGTIQSAGGVLNINSSAGTSGATTLTIRTISDRKISIGPSSGFVGSTTITYTDESTSPTTGALIVNGGVGVSGSLNIAGHMSAATKAFIIPHPTKEGKRLQYACLEGPENGVYVRGKTRDTYISLPDYWYNLVDIDSITVDLTPIGKFQGLYVIHQNSIGVLIGGVDGEYNYVVHGERKDVAKLETEI